MTNLKISPKNSKNMGFFFGVAAFCCWGFFPLYWKLFYSTSSLFITNWRVIFTVITLYFFLFLRKEMGSIIEIFKNKKLLTLLIFSNICISINWFVFIWVIQLGESWQSSLGYYLSPIVTVLIATLFLKEKLAISTIISCMTATAGIILLFIEERYFPWYALLLAISFSAYGLLKKKISIPPYLSLAFEVTTIIPVCLFYLLWSYFQQTHLAPVLNLNIYASWLILSLSGPLTILPLVLYSRSAQLIPLSNLGMLQFISPTIQFCIAFFIFQEPFSPHKISAFFIIWLALLIYILGPLWHLFRNNSKIKMQ